MSAFEDEIESAYPFTSKAGGHKESITEQDGGREVNGLEEVEEDRSKSGEQAF